MTVRQFLIDIECLQTRVTLDGIGGGVIEALPPYPTTHMQHEKAACPCCNCCNCYFSCDMSQSDLPESTETEEDVRSRQVWNSSLDLVESLILSHAIEGVKVDDYRYLRGVTNTMEALANHAD